LRFPRGPSALRKFSLSAAVLVAAAVPGAASAAPFISEIFFDAPAASEGDFEWIEIHNPDALDLDLAGWTIITTNGTSTRTLPLTAPTMVPAGGQLLVAATATLGALTPCDVAPVVYGTTLTLYNTDPGAAVELHDPAAALIDRVVYLDGAGGFPPATAGKSVAVVDVAMGNDLAANWARSDCLYAAGHSGTPGTPNQTCTAVLDAGSPVYACLPEPPDAGPPDAGDLPDAAVVDLDGGVIPDAAVLPDAGPPPPATLFISEIYFDAPGTSDTNLEWVEIFNPTASAVSLDGFTIRATGSSVKTHVLGADAVVPAGGVLLLASTMDLGGVTSCPVTLVVFGGVLSIYNSGSVLLELLDTALLPVDQVAYRTGGFPAAVEGHSLAVRDVLSPNLNNQASNWMVADCPYGTRNYGNPPAPITTYGTPGLINSACGADGGMPALMCVEIPDAGSVVVTDGGGGIVRDGGDAGRLEPLDASALTNNPPSLTVTSPATDLTGGAASVTIEYLASDPDGDALLISILRAPLGDGISGDEVLSGQPNQGPVTWQLASSPPGRYRVLVRVDDGHGNVVVSAAPGTVEVSGNGAGAPALSVERPKGGESVGDSLSIVLRTTATDGTLSVFYDTDSSGADGTAIQGGIRATPGLHDVVWKAANVPNGEYVVYAVLDAPAGRVVAYARGAVTVSRGSGPCGCSETNGEAPLAGGLMLFCSAILVRAAAHRRGR